jgi:hypothetical protein
MHRRLVVLKLKENCYLSFSYMTKLAQPSILNSELNV